MFGRFLWRLLFRLLLLLARLRFRLVAFFAGRKPGIFAITDGEQDGAAGPEYHHRYFVCADGLRLHFRDYDFVAARPAHARDGATVLCLHGLTRNAADFDEIARLLSRRYRVIALDQRGRGYSDHDPNPRRYRPDVYMQDTLQLIRTLNLDNILLLGTSMGALMSIMLGAMAPSRFCGMILNEAGPVVEPKGLEQLREYLRNVRPVSSWDEAEQLCREMYAPAYPDFDGADWQRHACKTWVDDGNGRPVTAYDPEIARSVVAQPQAAVPPDLWPLFEAASPVPVLVLRGELSEILSPRTVEEMCRRHPDCRAVTVPRVGHAPTLAEPVSEQAIMEFARRVAG